MSWDRVERLLGTENLALLATKRVGVVGLGSGGGFVAQSLAMSGVGKFVLVDDDVIDETNIVRHVADRAHLGRPKAEVLEALIKGRNPDADIDVRVGRIEDHMDVLDGLDVLVVGVDHENAKYVINQACVDDGALSAVYAGVYERGEGGDVVVIRQADDSPCYACWAAELRDGLAMSEIADGEELDYGMIGETGTLDAEPGLWLHVVRVAAVQADLALNELLVGTSVHVEMPGNTVVLANRSLEIIEGVMSQPHTAVWVNITRDPHCLVCGDAVRRRTRLADASTEGDDSLSLDDLMSATGLTLDEDE